jgi:hypothetical protein
MCIERCSKLCEEETSSSKFVASFHQYKTHTHESYIFQRSWVSFLRCTHGTKPGAENPNLDDISTSKENQIVHRVPPKNDHDSR